jgi:hypothetical protein
MALSIPFGLDRKETIYISREAKNVTKEEKRFSLKD